MLSASFLRIMLLLTRLWYQVAIFFMQLIRQSQSEVKQWLTTFTAKFPLTCILLLWLPHCKMGLFNLLEVLPRRPGRRLCFSHFGKILVLTYGDCDKL